MNGEIRAGIYSELHTLDVSGLHINVVIHLNATGGSAAAWRMAV